MVNNQDQQPQQLKKIDLAFTREGSNPDHVSVLLSLKFYSYAVVFLPSRV